MVDPSSGPLRLRGMDCRRNTLIRDTRVPVPTPTGHLSRRPRPVSWVLQNPRPV